MRNVKYFLIGLACVPVVVVVVIVVATISLAKVLTTIGELVSK